MPYVAQALPSKEQTLFKQIVKFYETKQYKKGMKAADAVLKKFPEHGETLAMKGLTLSHMDLARKEEAYELVRSGLKFHLQSHVCWHVYGLLYRADREYREAAKCYLNALRQEKDNLQILRDLSLLQIQLRDYEGYVETRRKLLTLKPSQKNNWISFAVAHHLNGKYDDALTVLNAYQGTTEEVLEHERYEHSEMLLYKASIMLESGQYALGIEEINNNLDDIKDKEGREELLSKLYAADGKLEEAAAMYRSLIQKAPDNYDYHRCLSSAYEAEGKEVAVLYKELREQYPKSAAAKRIPLDFLKGEEFTKAFSEYIKPFLRKGVPSLYSDIKSLYSEKDKVERITKVIEETNDSLSTTNTFPGESDTERPTTLVWLRLLAARHYDKLHRLDDALGMIDAAIEHTPTIIDLYLCKANIMKHAGDDAAAAEIADQARKMDLADRYLNSYCTKRMLAAGNIATADEVVTLFTRDGDQMNNLYDMQCMWYEIAAGNAYLRAGELGKALKKFLAVGKHFADITEDQFDFHTYCIRKMTLRTYIRMLRVEDNLYAHKFYLRGAVGAITAYLQLADKPSQAAGEVSSEDVDMSQLSAAERKKIRNKQRKLAKEKAAAEAAAAEAAKEAAKLAHKEASKGSKRGGSREVDPDPDGNLLLKTEDPIGEAVKIVRVLEVHSRGYMETHRYAFEVHLRRGRHSLALRAVKRARKLDENSPEAHRLTVRFFHAIATLPEGGAAEGSLPQVVGKVVASAKKEFLGSKSLEEFNAAWLSSPAGATLRGAAVGAEMYHLITGCGGDEAAALVLGSSWKTEGPCAVPPGGHGGLLESIAVHELLEKKLKSSAASDAWMELCARAYPYSSHFKGSKFLEKAAQSPVQETSVDSSS